MFTFKQFKVGGNFEQNARQAVQAEFDETQLVPNSVMVKPDTTELETLAVGLGNPSQIYNIPIVIRNDSLFEKDEFALDVSHGNLEAFVEE